jgi:hypothetical protein
LESDEVWQFSRSFLARNQHFLNAGLADSKP